MSRRSTYEDDQVNQFHLAVQDVDRETVDAVASVLRLTERYGDEATDVATDVLAALAVVRQED